MLDDTKFRALLIECIQKYTGYLSDDALLFCDLPDLCKILDAVSISDYPNYNPITHEYWMRED